MTGPAVLCWAAHFGWAKLDDLPVAFLHHPVSLVVFTLLALGELIADKLPFIPSRITAGPLVVRFVSGGLCGLAFGLPSNLTSWIVGALTGGIGAVAGSFAGYHLRRWLTSRRGLSDLPVALGEDVVAVGLGLLLASWASFATLVIFSGFL
jgi:uncharacterized membrane protein